MNNKNVTDYVHPQLNTEITAIGGHYMLTNEVRVPFLEKEIIYLVGYAVVDTSCCGAGGCGYARVPGFLVKYRFKKDNNGDDISLVEPIRDPSMQKEISALIKKDELVQQILFD